MKEKYRIRQEKDLYFFEKRLKDKVWGTIAVFTGEEYLEIISIFMNNLAKGMRKLNQDLKDHERKTK